MFETGFSDWLKGEDGWVGQSGVCPLSFLGFGMLITGVPISARSGQLALFVDDVDGMLSTGGTGNQPVAAAQRLEAAIWSMGLGRRIWSQKSGLMKVKLLRIVRIHRTIGHQQVILSRRGSSNINAVAWLAATYQVLMRSTAPGLEPCGAPGGAWECLAELQQCQPRAAASVPPLSLLSAQSQCLSSSARLSCLVEFVEVLPQQLPLHPIHWARKESLRLDTRPGCRQLAVRIWRFQLPRTAWFAFGGPRNQRLMQSPGPSKTPEAQL